MLLWAVPSKAKLIIESKRLTYLHTSNYNLVVAQLITGTVTCEENVLFLTVLLLICYIPVLKIWGEAVILL